MHQPQFRLANLDLERVYPLQFAVEVALLVVKIDLDWLDLDHALERMQLRPDEEDDPDADKLAKQGISAEVIDLRTLRPLDTQTTPLPHSAPMMRADAPAPPRGPPTELFF